jgi:RNA polymerase sigma factor (sigma-70 family)
MLLIIAGVLNSSIRTRPSLLKRLEKGDDAESWQDFYRIYGKLVRDFAAQAGLTANEADEVVQETAIGTAKHLSDFRYDAKVCRFKTWLLNLASWRVKDQLKKRQRAAGFSGPAPGNVNVQSSHHDDESSRTPTIDRVPDPGAIDLDALFEKEWRKNLFEAALEKVKRGLTLKQFQIFDLLVVQEWPARQVAKALSVSMANVYVCRHRVSSEVKREVRRLERQMESAANRASEK